MIVTRFCVAQIPRFLLYFSQTTEITRFLIFYNKNGRLYSCYLHKNDQWAPVTKI